MPMSSPQMTRMFGFFCVCSAMSFAFHFLFFSHYLRLKKYFLFCSSLFTEPPVRIERDDVLLSGCGRVPPTISILRMQRFLPIATAASRLGVKASSKHHFPQAIVPRSRARAQQQKQKCRSGSKRLISRRPV